MYTYFAVWHAFSIFGELSVAFDPTMMNWWLIQNPYCLLLTHQLMHEGHKYSFVDVSCYLFIEFFSSMQPNDNELEVCFCLFFTTDVSHAFLWLAISKWIWWCARAFSGSLFEQIEAKEQTLWMQLKHVKCRNTKENTVWIAIESKVNLLSCAVYARNVFVTLWMRSRLQPPPHCCNTCEHIRRNDKMLWRKKATNKWKRIVHVV